MEYKKLSTQLFDVVVIDTNFFISLLNAGVIDSLLPNLADIANSVGMTIIIPDELPKSDIPGKYRELRTLVPKYIQMEPVNRDSKLWKNTARYAIQERMVRVNEDPADIDIVILAKKFSLRNNNQVALVSDDEGVARIIKENKQFKSIEHLSCGAFVSVLAASVSDIGMRKILDDTVERVFKASWSYKKKTRRYIDVAMLIEDLTDTARFVRSAAQVGSDTSSSGVLSSQKELELLEPEDALILTQQLIIKTRESREKFNLPEAENMVLEILLKSSELIYQIDELEQRVIVERMLRSELFEHHSWLLDFKLTRNQIIEALVHTEACRVYMNFISVGKEAIENIISLQGLLYLLLGRYEQALSLFRRILPESKEVSTTQLLGLTISLIANKQPNEAFLLLNKYRTHLDGMLNSMHTYANDLYSHDQRELAIEILKFIVKSFTDREGVERSIKRLFILTRLRSDLVELDLKVQKIFKQQLRETSLDNTKRGISAALRNILPIELSPADEKGSNEEFKGFYHILDIMEVHDRDELNVIAWNEGNNSTWNLVFDAAYKPALEESVKIKITSGTINDIKPSKKGEIFRGTIIFQNPAIQPEMVKPW